jgi:hypothetical protein
MHKPRSSSNRRVQKRWRRCVPISAVVALEALDEGAGSMDCHVIGVDHYPSLIHFLDQAIFNDPRVNTENIGKAIDSHLVVSPAARKRDRERNPNFIGDNRRSWKGRRCTLLGLSHHPRLRAFMAARTIRGLTRDLREQIEGAAASYGEAFSRLMAACPERQRAIPR